MHFAAQKHIPLDEMTGARVVILANLKKKPLAGFASHGVVICAGDEKVELLTVPAAAKVGERITIPAIQGEGQAYKDKETAHLAPPNDKSLKRVLKLLTTDGEMRACYDGKAFEVAGGFCSAKTLANVAVK